MEYLPSVPDDTEGASAKKMQSMVDDEENIYDYDDDDDDDISVINIKSDM